jgi:hypothetical protein
MKNIITISTFIIATLLTSFKFTSNRLFITGHIYKNPKAESPYFQGISIFVKADNKVVANAITSDKGDFSLVFTPINQKSFDFYCSGVGIDTILLLSTNHFESDHLEMTFHIPSNIKKNLFGKAYCPKCKKTDKVFEIEYGDAPVYVRKISKHGDTTYSPIYKGKYQAGTCIGGLATYYCDRDKIKF